MLFSVEWERGLLTKRLLNFLATLDFSTFSLSYIHIHPISVVSFCHPDSTCASDETSLTLSEQPGAKPNSPFLKKSCVVTCQLSQASVANTIWSSCSGVRAAIEQQKRLLTMVKLHDQLPRFKKTTPTQNTSTHKNKIDRFCFAPSRITCQSTIIQFFRLSIISHSNATPSFFLYNTSIAIHHHSHLVIVLCTQR
jgi:hypothetical protein